MQWPEDGVPDNPRAWLIQVASRRMTDYRRSERPGAAGKLPTADGGPRTGGRGEPDESDAEHDDTLVLLFMCGHPPFCQSSAIALTLRAVGGLTTAEIAHAFLVPEATMAQRISRAKAKTIVRRAVPHAHGRRTRRAAQGRAARPLPDLQRGLREQQRA